MSETSCCCSGTHIRLIVRRSLIFQMSLLRKDARRTNTRVNDPWVRSPRNRCFEFWMNRRRTSNRDLHVSFILCRTCARLQIFMNEASSGFRHGPRRILSGRRDSRSKHARRRNYVHSVTRTHMHTCTRSPLYTYNGHSFTAIHRTHRRTSTISLILVRSIFPFVHLSSISD